MKNETNGVEESITFFGELVSWPKIALADVVIVLVLEVDEETEFTAVKISSETEEYTTVLATGSTDVITNDETACEREVDSRLFVLVTYITFAVSLVTVIIETSWIVANIECMSVSVP
jgi:hypothetical protein